MHGHVIYIIKSIHWYIRKRSKSTLLSLPFIIILTLEKTIFYLYIFAAYSFLLLECLRFFTPVPLYIRLSFSLSGGDWSERADFDSDSFNVLTIVYCVLQQTNTLTFSLYLFSSSSYILFCCSFRVSHKGQRFVFVVCFLYFNFASSFSFFFFTFHRFSYHYSNVDKIHIYREKSRNENKPLEARWSHTMNQKQSNQEEMFLHVIHSDFVCQMRLSDTDGSTEGNR